MPRLAHGWRLTAAPEVAPELIREFVRPPVHAVPGTMARRLGPCRISVHVRLPEPELASQWKEAEGELQVDVAAEGLEPHDVALELLLCLGQALWEKADNSELEAYARVLQDEIESGVSGEIDPEALAEKQSLLSSRVLASSPRQFRRYARASFSGTAAEYVHCLWHDVTLREGPEFLPPGALMRRLELLARWFPPDRGYRLLPRGCSKSPAAPGGSTAGR
jgi:hypothetical protein